MKNQPRTPIEAVQSVKRKEPKAALGRERYGLVLQRFTHSVIVNKILYRFERTVEATKEHVSKCKEHRRSIVENVSIVCSQMYVEHDYCAYCNYCTAPTWYAVPTST